LVKMISLNRYEADNGAIIKNPIIALGENTKLVFDDYEPSIAGVGNYAALVEVRIDNLEDEYDEYAEENCIFVYPKWDTDGESPEELNLPTCVIVPLEADYDDLVSDYLSEFTGFCVESYTTELCGKNTSEEDE
nr:hypothetical protein [Lachnospiraceae bacterium]